MSMALELSGLQISKWFGGGRTKKNYYCPKEITSVFAWRIYLMTVLNAIEKSETLMDFNQTYGKWHEKARKELNDILKCQYSIISNYDENKEREDHKQQIKRQRRALGSHVMLEIAVCQQHPEAQKSVFRQGIAPHSSVSL